MIPELNLPERLSRWVFCAIAIAGVAACGGPEARLAGYIERGQEFYADRNFEKARVEFSNALQIDPANAQARFMAGQVAERLGNPRDALGQYQAAIDADSRHTEARAALARLYLFGGLADRAMELTEAGLTADPGNDALLTVRGAAKSQLGDQPGAMADVEAALAANASNELAIALQASLYRQANDTTRAVEVARAGVERLPENVDLRVILADLELLRKNNEGAEAQLLKTVELQPDFFANWQRLARFYVLTGNGEAAERAMRDGIRVAPDNVEAKLALAEFLGAQRGPAAAEQQMQEFVAAEPGNSQLKLAMGRYYEVRSNFDRAEATYREVIDGGNAPARLTARNRVAVLLAQRKDVAGAEVLIAEVLTENPRDNDALVLRANLALERNDAPAAIADLRSVLRDQPNAAPIMRALARAHLQNNEASLAEETLRAAIEARPQDIDTRYDLADLLVRTGRLEQARPMLERLASEAPGNLQVIESLFKVQASGKDLAGARVTADNLQRTRPDLALGYYLAGLVDESEGKTDAAIALYEQALQIQPDGTEPLAALIRLDVRLNRQERALARLDSTVDKYPNNGVARNLKGELLVAMQRFTDAQSAFGEAIKVAPQWWIPYRGLAISKLAAKDTEGAIAAFRSGIENTQGAAGLSTDLAALYERLGRTDDAIKVYEGMLAKSPTSPAAANNLAMLLVSYRTDDASLDRAKQLADQLADSEVPSMVNTRGWVHYKRGEYAEALPLLQRAADRSPDSPVMLYHLGMAQLKLGNRDAARVNLEAALRSERAFAGIEEARSALEEARRAG